MIETVEDTQTFNDIDCLTKLGKEELERASTILKENGQYEVANRIDIAISHILLEEMKSGKVELFTEEDFKKRFARYQ